MEPDSTNNSVIPHAGLDSRRVLRNLTPLAKRSLLISSVSTLIAAAASISGTADPADRAFGLWMLPHLIVVALLAIGMLGGHSVYGGLATNGPAFLLAFLQVPLLITAISDLAKNRKMKSQSLQLVDYLVGLGLPLTRYLVAWGMSAGGAK